MTDENKNISTLPVDTGSEMEIVSFPTAAKVCETTEDSSLQEFNPLNDSEPNLEFDMTNQNNASQLDLHVKLIQDAKTQKWQVKIWNLSKEQIDFIAGPRLLPILTKADVVVISHGDTVSAAEDPDIAEPPLPTPVLTTNTSQPSGESAIVLNKAEKNCRYK